MQRHDHEGGARLTMALDIAPLWDFGRPEVSEQRFREALQQATGDDALILQTQIARSHGLRRNFITARQVLAAIEPRVSVAGFEARTRYELELGRTFASATHPPEARTPDDRERARKHYEAALAIAREGKLDALAIDAIHMLAFVDAAPTDQLKWGRAALAVVESSSQAAAKRWEGSVRNNIGVALHKLGRYEEALDEFRRALAARERDGNAQSIRIAHWMVAWTLRAMDRIDEALAIQLRLENENAAAGAPDRHVFEELEALYRAKGDAERAARYANRKDAAAK